MRKHELHDAQITLPNNTLFRYSEYTVPCCEDCNSLMGETFEVPISKVFNDGYDAVANFMREPGGLNKPFLWLSLIYLKTHLKDLSLRMHRDLCLQQMVHQESFVQGSEARFMLALPFEDPAACLRMIDEYVDSMVEKPEEGQ